MYRIYPESVFSKTGFRLSMPDKIVWNDFKQALPGPQSEGQEARSNDEMFVLYLLSRGL